MDNIVKPEVANNSIPSDQIPPKQNVKSSSLTSIIALLIALIACAGNAGLYIWSKKLVSLHLQQVQNINQQQTNSTQQITQQVVQLQNQLLQQQNNVSNMQTSIQKLIQVQPGTNRIWTLSEVNYLVSLANLQLHYNNSVANAILLLQEANLRLTHLVDPSLSSITQSINENLTKLQALPAFNLTDVLTRLNNLHENVFQLEQVAQPQTTIVIPTTTSNVPDMKTLPWWKKLYLNFWNSFKQLVVVDYHNKPLPQLLPPEQQLFLQQNLQLLIVQTQWAALQGNQTIYNDSLNKAKNWIKEYYIQDAPHAKAFLQELNALQQINIHPTYPDLTPTMNLSNSVINSTPKSDNK